MYKVSIGVLWLTLSSVCIADIWTVDDDGKADFNTIQAAIDAASDGDEIIVSAGTYTSASSVIVNTSGKAITILSVSGASVTIIDGQNQSRGILCVQGESSSTVLDGFTIQNCIAPWYDWDRDGYVDDWEYSGAGIGCDLSNPTILNCVFQNNQASQNGGGMFNYASSPSLTNCTFQNNSASSLGGGMYNYSGSHPTITLSTFSANTSNHLGGGMYNRYLSSPTIDYTTFDSNSAVNGGGGMYNSAQSDVMLTNCTISNNSCTDTNGNGGGGLAFFNSSPTLTNCSIINNNSAKDGGGIYGVVGCNIVINNCTISNNMTLDVGAGVFLAFMSTCSINDSTIENNSANDFGGGIFINETVDVDLINSQIEFNFATLQGGGVSSTRHSSLRMENSLIDNNDALLGADIFAQRDSLVQFASTNVVGDLEVLFAGTKLEFLPSSSLTISGTLTPPQHGSLAFDIGNFNSPAPLTITGELVRQGSLSVTNYSNSLNNASVGQTISLMQVATLSDSLFDSIVVPDMASGKGLVILYNSGLLGESTEIVVEVVEVDEVEFSDTLLSDLDGPPVDLVSCDIDGDGTDEIAILFHGFPGSVALFRASENNEPPVYIEGTLTNVGNAPVDLDAGDIDGDGVEDLLVANAVDSTISLLKNANSFSGKISLTEKVIPIQGVYQVLNCVAIIDWDGDGDKDAVVGIDQLDESLEDRYVVVRNLNSETPIYDASFDIPKYSLDEELVSDPPISVAGANETAWGFVAGTRFGRVHRGTYGRASLSLVAELDGNRITIIEAIELDDGSGDGQLDLLVASDEAQSLFLFQGDENEDDGFGEIITINISLEVSDVVVIDADSDGDKDFVITAPESDDPIVLLRNDGVAGFLPGSLIGRIWSKQDMASASAPSQVATGRLSGKGEDDDWLSSTTQEAQFFRGASANTFEQTNLIATHCTGDVDGDDTVGVDDLLLLIGAWGSCGGCQEDLNDDGVVNVDDLLILIGAWGACR